MPVPPQHRDFLREVGMIEPDPDGADVLIGLTLRETDEWLRLALDRTGRWTNRYRNLVHKHENARRERGWTETETSACRWP